MAKQPPEDVTKQRIENKINNTLEVSDVLSGRKPIGGRLGAKLKQKKDEELDINKGKEARHKKFKEFDEWNDKVEKIYRDATGNDMTIKRAIIPDKTNPNKITNS